MPHGKTSDALSCKHTNDVTRTRLLKYVPATSSAFFSHQNISKNTYFKITKKNGSEISLHVHFNICPGLHKTCRIQRYKFFTK